jgi:predicted kinase
VLIGAPGAGKSTFASALAELGTAEIVSSDAVAEDLFGPAYDSRHDPEIFGERDRRIREHLASGRMVVADSTNVTPAARLRLIALGRAAGAQVTAIRFPVVIETLLARAATRDKDVADISWFHEQFVEHASTESLLHEGFDVIVDAPTWVPTSESVAIED